MSPFVRPIIVATALLALPAACAKEQGQTGAKTEAKKTMEERTQGESPAAGTSSTGALSEEAFKALHELKTEPAPPARGMMIELDGEWAYLSLPEQGEPPFPGIVVIQEWWGLNDHIKHWSDRLAADGYAALAVDLYGGGVADTPDSAMALMRGVDKARAVEILRSGHAFLANDSRVRATRRGSVGWCFGGGMSLNLALAAPDLDAAVIYYGPLETDPEKLKAIKAVILGHFGNADESITPSAVNQFEAALKTAGVEHEIYRYDAGHGFANPSGKNYDEPDAALAWERTRAFLSKHLKSAK